MAMWVNAFQAKQSWVLPEEIGIVHKPMLHVAQVNCCLTWKLSVQVGEWREGTRNKKLFTLGFERVEEFG